MHNNKIIAYNLETLGKRFRKKYLTEWENNKLDTNSWQALKFFFSHSFMRGRRDELSIEYYEFTINSLLKYFDMINIEDSGFFFEKLIILKSKGLFNTNKIKELRKENRNSIKHPDFDRKIKNNNPLIAILTTKSEIEIKFQNKIYKKYICLQNDIDLLMVLETLDFISSSSIKANLYKYFNELIKNNQIGRAYLELKKIAGIGDKISTFYLRDIAIINNYDLPVNQLEFVFPVDTWVEQIASLLSDQKFAAGKPNEIKKYFIDNFAGNNIPLIAAGIWFLGFNSLDILIEYIKEKKLKE